VVDLANVSGQRLAVPEGWQAGRSRVVEIEYPVGDVPPSFVDSTRLQVAAKPDGSEEILLYDALPAGSTVRLTFTLDHQVDSQTDTVPVRMVYGVCALAASIVCGQLASLYANQSDSTIQADSVEHKSKSELYRARERQYFEQAYISCGLPVPTAKGGDGGHAGGSAASATVSFGSRRGTHAQRGLRWS
jgi:hypothetical protein